MPSKKNRPTDTAVITINEDEKCPNCGKPGAVNGGLCLECINKKLAHQPESIVIESTVIVSAKHDLLTRGVKLMLEAPFKAFPEDIRIRLADLVVQETGADIELQPEGDTPPIQFASANLTGLKHDMVARVVRLTFGLSFSQLTAEIRKAIEGLAATQRPLQLSVTPQQQTLFEAPQGRLD